MSTLGSLGNGGSNLGNLAQSARMKHLKQAKTTMIVIGVLTILVQAFMLLNSEKEVREVAGAAAPEQFQMILMTVRLIYGGALALGVVFVVLGFLVPKFPVPATIAGLILYIGATAVFALLSPASLLSGIIIKVIIIVSLFKAVTAAVAYQRESAELESLNATGAEVATES